MRAQIYTPGAGHMPPELAGRDELLANWEAMLAAVDSRGRVASEDTVLTGLRGVGKSVLLSRLAELAERAGYHVLRLQGSKSTSLTAALTQQAAERAKEQQAAWGRARDALASISSASLTVGPVGGSLGWDRAGQPATGQHPEAVAGVLAALATDLRGRNGGGLVISVDEFQMTRAEDIRLIGAVLNQLNTVHPRAAVVLVAAGLPNTQARMMGPNPEQPFITNPERLFRFHQIPSHLSFFDAAVALLRPAQRVGAGWSGDAIEVTVAASEGYPAHLQIHAAAAWALGEEGEPVSQAHALHGSEAAQQQIERQYLEPRWKNLAPRQRAYITALALCGGEASSGQVAAVLGTKTAGQSKRRDALIGRGEIFDPEYGRIQLSMPAMRQYALARYPEVVAREDDDDLITLQHMQENLDAWSKARASRATRGATQPEQITDRP